MNTKPEDYMICTKHRPYFELRGVRYAPLDVARKFAIDDEWDFKSKITSFGFHGQNKLSIV